MTATRLLSALFSMLGCDAEVTLMKRDSMMVQEEGAAVK